MASTCQLDEAYGGDEGLSLPQRAELGWLDLGNEVVFYYVVLFFSLFRSMASQGHAVPLGRVVIAIRENERSRGIGLPVHRYQLACFVIAGAVAGLAGALLASHGKYVNPNVLHWVQSGTLMIMVILGGVGQLWAGPSGVRAPRLEHVISDYRSPGSPPWRRLPAARQPRRRLVMLASCCSRRTASPGCCRGGAVLELRRVSKRFVGVVATTT